MKLKFTYSVSIISMIFIVLSCSKKAEILNSNTSIRIVAIDSTKFDHYNEYDFEFESGEKGKILQEKVSVRNIRIKKLLRQNAFSDFKLCDITKFKFNGKNGVTLIGHGTESGIYEGGNLLIDLSNDAKIRYYKIC